MLKSNEIVLMDAQITVYAHNGVKHSLVNKFLSSASRFNLEKLLTFVTCTIGKGKLVQTPRGPRQGECFFSKGRSLLEVGLVFLIIPI